MNIEIVAIGNEILAGITANTNAAFISKEVLKEGFSVERHTVLPDDPAQLLQGLQEALQRSRITITTGGLGPTCDDITRQTAAELFHSDFTYNAEIADDLKKMRYGNLATIQNQATVPTKAMIMKNNAGTAPGFIFHENTSTLIMLPGVPSEMRAMLPQAITFLKKTIPLPKRFFKHLNLFNVTEAEADPLLRALQEKNPDVEFGIYPGQGILALRLTSSAPEKLSAPYDVLNSTYSDALYESPSGKIEEAVHQRCLKEKKTLSAAESCTGGSFAARLTQLPGASEYFLGSIVAYSNELKMSLLDVPECILQTNGAVSKETATAMLEGLFAKTGSDYGVAVTGIAGPAGGTPEKPVGTVWCAVGRRGQPPHVWKIHAYGNREMIIERSVNALLASLLINISPQKFASLLS